MAASWVKGTASSAAGDHRANAGGLLPLNACRRAGNDFDFWEMRAKKRDPQVSHQKTEAKDQITEMRLDLIFSPLDTSTV